VCRCCDRCPFQSWRGAERVVPRDEARCAPEGAAPEPDGEGCARDVLSPPVPQSLPSSSSRSSGSHLSMHSGRSSQATHVVICAEHGDAVATPQWNCAEVSASVPKGRAMRRAIASALSGADAVTGLPGMPSATPISLHAAAYYGDVGIARLLVGAGAGVNAVDGWGATPLHYAAGAGCAELVRELLGAAADAQAGDSQHRTPLHHAASGPSTEVVRVLLRHRGDPCARDAMCDTPLSIALQVRHQEIALAMVEPVRGSRPAEVHSQEAQHCN